MDPVETWLDTIIDQVRAESGYPYGEKEEVPEGKALAYGIAIGSLWKAKHEWIEAREKGRHEGEASEA